MLDKMGWFALVILAILFFLVLNNAKASVAVVNALGGNATALTGALQGRPVQTSNGVKLASASGDSMGGGYGGGVFA